jgi:hypothetical protein
MGQVYGEGDDGRLLLDKSKMNFIFCKLYFGIIYFTISLL